MRATRNLVAALALAAALSAAGARAEPGLFTEAQAADGAALYARHCASCHRADLRGGPHGPPLAGAAFARQWGARTAAELVAFDRERMPPGEAAELFRRALTVWRALGDRDNEATMLNRLGLTLDQLGDSLAARQLFEQALALWQEMGDPGGEVPVRLNLCLTLQRQGDFVDARDCYQAVLTSFASYRSRSVRRRCSATWRGSIGSWETPTAPWRSIATARRGPGCSAAP